MSALRKALEKCLLALPGLEVRSWPPGFRLKKEAIEAARAALAEPDPAQAWEGLTEGEKEPVLSMLRRLTNGTLTHESAQSFAAALKALGGRP